MKPYKIEPFSLLVVGIAFLVLWGINEQTLGISNNINPDKKITADQIIERYYNALGGLDKLHKIETLVKEGTIEDTISGKRYYGKEYEKTPNQKMTLVFILVSITIVPVLTVKTDGILIRTPVPES